jgi:hypothetical protein
MAQETEGSNAILIIYFVVSPQGTTRYRIYDEEDIQAFGGVHAVERALERKSYWFVRLGEILGESNPTGVTFSDADVSKLIVPPKGLWQIGMRNPAFHRSELERHLFKAAFEAVERMLESWSFEENGVVDAYWLKELNISSECLTSLAGALRNVRQVHEIACVTVVKYWYDLTWPEPHDADSLLAEFSLNIPFRVQWSCREEMLDVQILPLSPC